LRARPRRRSDRMKRRAFIAGLGGVAAWPLVTRAQNAGRARRVGVLAGISGDDPEAQLRYAAFLEELRKLGWTNGQNVEVEVRRGAADAKLLRQYAAELIALKPDVMVSAGSLSAETLLPLTSTVPIIFTIVNDPVGAGLVKSLSRPGGNATGFMQFEYTL